ncbi:MAG: CDP-alcohol phosphatidyltransferase family protein [Pseudomonadota bacterium]
MSGAPQSAAEARRPIPSRGTAWARWMTARLAATRITPNQISQLGLAMAVLAGLALLAAPAAGGWFGAGLLVTAVALIGLRLLCNMLDGLLAVEARRGALDGAFWNEVPDRLADCAILIGAGFGLGAGSLGLAAALAAVLTAYIRVFGAALGQPADFRGPLAKPQRMAVLALAGLVDAALLATGGAAAALELALWVVLTGALLTAARRTRTLRSRLAG